MSGQHWRLIHSIASSGAWNMALDEALLETVGKKESPPVLRLYAWHPPCLSLGYAQSIRDVDKTAIEKHGWHIVRRPTGGRAILHADELTYAIITPLDEPCMAGGVLESYRRLSKALLLALFMLGVPAQAAQKKTDKLPLDPVCYEVPSSYEITVDQKKIIGSAQARKRNSVLQHGSLPLYGDITRINQVLLYPDETQRQNANQRLLDRAITVEACLGRKISWQEAASSFEFAFQQTLEIDFQVSELTPQETQRTEELIHERHAQSSWIERI